MKQSVEIPKWLKKTQNNSWEPEIFISGIVLYGLMQTPKYLDSFRYYFKREIFSFSNDIDTLIAILSTSVQWLIFGLILHLFFRGIWIGLVGLSYVFPKGINRSQLNYKGKFNDRIDKIPHFTDQIVRLEKISSSIFSMSYFIFMSIIGAYIYVVVAFVVPIYTGIYISGVSLGDINNYPNFISLINTYGFIVLGAGFIYMFDFLSLGLLKKVKFLSKLYYPIYLFISTLTLSSLYRNVYYTLISNFKAWKVIAFIIAFIFITLTLFNLNVRNSSFALALSRLELYGTSSDHFMSGSYYENMTPDAKGQVVTIQNDIITDDVLRIFVSHIISYEDSIKVNCDYKSLKNASSQDSLKLVCLGAFYQVVINDSLYNSPNWLFHKDMSTKHRGILGYVDISNLAKGSHQLNIQLKNWPRKNYALIPFYKQ